MNETHPADARNTNATANDLDLLVARYYIGRTLARTERHGAYEIRLGLRALGDA